MKEDLSEVKTRLEHAERLLEELHSWHNKEDENGVKLWYNKPSTERAITAMEGRTVEVINEVENLCQAMQEVITVIKGSD